jgi:hypothetical protein
MRDGTPENVTGNGHFSRTSTPWRERNTRQQQTVVSLADPPQPADVAVKRMTTLNPQQPNANAMVSSAVL